MSILGRAKKIVKEYTTKCKNKSCPCSSQELCFPVVYQARAIVDGAKAVQNHETEKWLKNIMRRETYKYRKLAKRKEK
jgi:hypothetical protein